MAYDDLKHHDGRAYSGMRVGGEHAWCYPNGRWTERKETPDRWRFTFESLKRRQNRAPSGSGAPAGTRYHWFVVGHQRVRKLDSNTYSTCLEGAKYKVAHRRPNWHRWSTEYPDRLTERECLIRILEDALERLRDDADDPRHRQTRLF